MAQPATAEPFPAAWVVRCPYCRGGLMYGLETAWSDTVLSLALAMGLARGGLWLDRAPIDRVLDLDYCTCTEAPG